MDVNQRYDCLMRTITWDRDIRGRRITSHANDLDRSTFFRFDHLGVGARTEFEYLALAVHRSTFEGAETNQVDVDVWVWLCSDTTSNRRMLLTAKGLVTTETQPWDVACLIMGLDAPFVLRKTDVDTYILVGEAYFHGAMDGDVLADASFEAPDILLQ